MTGPAGEDGMNVLQGPRRFNGTVRMNGAQGPAGPNQINSTDKYQNLGSVITSTLGSITGERVISGSL